MPELAGLRPTARTGDLSRALVRCGERLKAAGIDLGAFTTLQNAADLDTVRRELGYASVNLFGTSYGARLAQQALRGDPPWIRTVTLASPIPAEANFVQDAPRSYARALARTFAICAASPSCRRAYPALGRALDRGLRRLQARPARVRVTDPGTGRRTTVTVTAGTVSALLFSLFYAPDGPSAVPSIVSAIGEGDDRVIAELVAGGPLTAAPLSIGMQRAFLCQEEVARTTPAAFARGLRGLPRAARLLAGASPVIGRPIFATCAGWALPPADATTFAPVASSIPALVVTGQLDQITPPRYGVRVARGLARSVLVQVPGVGHSPLLAAGPCGVRILRAFVDRPDRRPPTACLRLAS
jgi:pimeloyl-ACP methyl ester carboxylesterase